MPSETVKVMVRCRPMNSRETQKNTFVVVAVEPQNFQIVLTNPEDKDIQKVFSYDEVFPPQVRQEEVYEKSAFSIVESVLEGYNGTIFAYGQTGCGKTHTMMGNPHHDELKGIIPRAFEHIFGKIGSTKEKDFLIRCSYIEIYNEEIHDLIGQDWNKKLELKESPDKGIFIKDLMIHTVKSIPEIERLMEKGAGNRKVGETAMNKDSSRSHSIFTIYIETSCLDEKGNQRITAGKLNLVDLAGSERQSKTKATGERLKEAQKINLSLSALGNVISALVDGKSQHIPYRDSKLTRLLQDSLGGNTKTVMIANCSPSSENYDETLGTLRYASRAKNIKNQPKINQDPKDALLKEYADEIKKLKMLLESGGTLDDAELEKIGLTLDKMGGGGTTRPQQSKKSVGNMKAPSDKNTYENELKQKEQAMMEERKRREELEQKIMQMQSNVGMVQGGQEGSSSHPDNEKKKYEEMAERMKEREKYHEELQQAKEQKEEELFDLNKKHSSLAEEVDDMRKKMRILKKKYKNVAKEIEDIEKEHEQDKEDLLDTIRLLDKDARVNAQIMMQILSNEDIDKIKKKAKWVEDKNTWVVTPFLVRANKVKFPKMSSYQQGVEMVKEDWKNREIEFLEMPKDDADDVEDFWAKDAPVNYHLKEGSGLGMLKDVRQDLHRDSQMSTNATFNTTKVNHSNLSSNRQSMDKGLGARQKYKSQKSLLKYNSRESLDEAPEFETVGKALNYDQSPDQNRKKPENPRLEPLSANIQRSNLNLYDKASNNSMLNQTIQDKTSTNNVGLPGIKPQGKLKPLNPLKGMGRLK